MRLPAALLLLVLVPAGHCRADVVALSDPFPSVCVTSDGALYSVMNGALRPMSGVFSIAPPGGHALALQTSEPTRAAPGELVRMYVASPQPLDSLSLELRGPGNRLLSRASTFRLSDTPERQLWCVLFGIPSGAIARDYRLSLAATAGTRSWLSLRPITVSDRSYKTEKISITKQLTTLKTAPDPRKATETQVLARVLATAHLDAVYEAGALVAPLTGVRTTSGFGDRREYDYSDGSSEVVVHQGLDLASPEGTPVPASGRGRVVFAGLRILTGNTVVIEHLPGVFSLYFHMSAFAVKEGELVEKGQKIGAVGMTGFATGPHLHWEVQVAGTSVDPGSLTSGALLDKDPVFADIEPRTSGEGR